MQSMPDYCQQPSLGNKLRELGAVAGLPFRFLRPPSLRDVPEGDGRPVVLLPGYTAGPKFMEPLAKFLRSKNYDVAHWGLGINQGDFDTYAHQLGKGLAHYSQSSGTRMTLVGWSLGGAVAREIARLWPEGVREIITMGTPIVGGPKYSSVCNRFCREQDIDPEAFEREVHRRNSEGIDVPITAIHTKSDGVVCWKSCVDVYNSQARNIEVQGAHTSLPLNRDVWEIVGHTLSGECVSDLIREPAEFEFLQAA